MGKNRNEYRGYFGGQSERIPSPETIEPQVEETPVPEVSEVPEEANQPAELTVTKVVVTGAARVNVRAGHNKDAQVITVLPEGAEITFLDHTPDGWDKVMLKDGTEGYMMSKFLKRI